MLILDEVSEDEEIYYQYVKNFYFTQANDKKIPCVTLSKFMTLENCETSLDIIDFERKNNINNENRVYFFYQNEVFYWSLEQKYFILECARYRKSNNVYKKYRNFINMLRYLYFNPKIIS